MQLNLLINVWDFFWKSCGIWQEDFIQRGRLNEEGGCKVFQRTEILKIDVCITKLENNSKSSSIYQEYQITRDALQNIVYLQNIVFFIFLFFWKSRQQFICRRSANLLTKNSLSRVYIDFLYIHWLLHPTFTSNRSCYSFSSQCTLFERRSLLEGSVYYYFFIL